jgi:hypothetical protein
MRKRCLLILLVLLALAVPALAIFGLGDIVFDPSNFEEAVQELAQMEQQYFQLVQTYQMVQNQYNQMLEMARQLPAQLEAAYRPPIAPWTRSQAPDVYGNTTPWTAGVNTGFDTPAGYSAATATLGAYGAAWNNIPADQMDRIKTNYATVELTDGANLAAMQTLGQIRSNASSLDAAIQNLENDSLSADPNLNTEIAVLNKINAAHVIALRSQESANQLLTALAEGQLVEAKRRRDAEAQAFNDHIQFMGQAQAVMAAQAAGASDAMMAWRMP